MPTEISAPLHLRTLLNGHTYLIADFYATWCPPCKMIAPVFEQLSNQNTVANKIAFVKINVDEQREIAAQYGIQAMPTFLVFRHGKVIETIKGANPPALKKAVEKATSEIDTASTSQTPTQHGSNAEANRAGQEQKTVAGSYGMTQGAHWKMRLS